ncbi:hypothetical protein [Leptospira bouyouniensis]|uniref:hypothetical protein n=1 Tax=Leptospira bouyouniensis TaxID=2484911 RepID=UPI00109176B0|nr:hypothetical protein [Leptospira bouyouniensis]TGM85093.1 hypothetical protein EHQ99_04865 [Leptospira bouyouniensis]
MFHFLWDNDILFKVVDWGLTPYFIDMIKKTRGRHFRLSAIPFVAKTRYLKKERNTAKYKLMEDLLEFFEEIPSLVSPNEKWNQINLQGLDSGEVILFQSLKEREGLLYTGDKNALKALQKIPTDFINLSYLHGKLLTWEDVLMHLLKSHPWAEIQNSLKDIQVEDGLFRVVFSKENRGYQNNSKSLAALESYVKENQATFSPFLATNSESLQRIFP